MISPHSRSEEAPLSSCDGARMPISPPCAPVSERFFRCPRFGGLCRSNDEILLLPKKLTDPYTRKYTPLCKSRVWYPELQLRFQSNEPGGYQWLTPRTRSSRKIGGSSKRSRKDRNKTLED